MDEFSARSDDVLVMLKPHAITDRARVEAAIRARPNGRFVVTDLHPMVLATHATLFVANYYSTTFADGHAMGVPTIEYSDYSTDALTVTGGGSMRAEYVTRFVNRDRAAFSSALDHFLESDRSAARHVPEASDLSPAFDLLMR